MDTRAMFSSATCEWSTPKALYEALEVEFGPFDLDPCPKGYDGLWSGLTESWEGRVYMNPPYGRQIGKWVKKAYESSLEGTLVVDLNRGKSLAGFRRVRKNGRQEMQIRDIH